MLSKKPESIDIFIKKNTEIIRRKSWELGRRISDLGITHRTVFADEVLDPRSIPDLVLVMGGDGTFLSASHSYSPHGVPLLGVDLGGLGFLAAVSIEELDTVILDICNGHYTLENRMLIDCRISRSGEDGEIHDCALNDVVIYRGPFAQMIRLSTHVDGEYLASFPADGLIVATSTGSTAYSLSAGGPVVFPELELFVITPICAHTLYARSIIALPTATVEVVLESSKEGTMVTVDGDRGYRIGKNDRIFVRKSPHSAKLVKLTRDKPFYSL
ncbi:MAG TPA: NAD(+)/NADH kinase, partial [Atribacteraceae bacterium]|nr:NAD(+)/NADH kinase [Atribacteraceae bacterium]